MTAQAQIRKAKQNRIQNLRSNVEASRRRTQKLQGDGVSASKAAAIRYRRDIDVLVKEMIIDVQTQIIPLLRATEPLYVRDAASDTLLQVMDSLRLKYSGPAINQYARRISTEMVQRENANNKAKTVAMIEKDIGINVSSILTDEGLDELFFATVRENVNLISSIPAEYFLDVERIVLNGVKTGQRAGSISKQLRSRYKIPANRAKLIARDQTSKLNGNLSQFRQEDLGITHYYWRTSEDERVRRSHKANDKKRFSWNKPPSTGHPGEDIQCRCVAEPDYSKVLKRLS